MQVTVSESKLRGFSPAKIELHIMLNSYANPTMNLDAKKADPPRSIAGPSFCH